MAKSTHQQGVLARDIGTPSVRALVYDLCGRMQPATLSDVPYKVRTTEPGEVSSDPKELVKLVAQSVDGALHAARKHNVDILAAGVSCYWHSLMGVDRSGRPTTELITWADTRSTAETRLLRVRFDERAYHARGAGRTFARFRGISPSAMVGSPISGRAPAAHAGSAPRSERRARCEWFSNASASPFPGEPSSTASIDGASCSAGR